MTTITFNNTDHTRTFGTADPRLVLGLPLRSPALASEPAPVQPQSSYSGPPRALFILRGEHTGCDVWRTIWPCQELQRRGYTALWRNADDMGGIAEVLNAQAVDLVVMPRVAGAPVAVAPWINACHRSGAAVIYEADDDQWTTACTERALTVFPDRLVQGREALEATRMERVALLRSQVFDGVTVSTPRLAEIARQLTNRPVELIPNSIDLRWFARVLRGVSRVIPPLTIGWAGATREDADLEPVGEAWHNLARRFPELRFVVQGFRSPSLLAAVPADRLSVLPWQPLETYPRAMLNIDIGCCAAAPRTFNLAKAPIKWLEMTAVGATCVVSPIVYSGVVTDGWDGLIASTPAEWETALARLVSERGLRRRLQRNARQTVSLHHSLDANWWRPLVAWQAVVEHYRARRRAEGVSL